MATNDGDSMICPGTNDGLSQDLLGGTSFKKAKIALEESFGTKDDDKVDGDNNLQNDKIDAYIEELGEVNYYTCMALIFLNPAQEFETFRGRAKIFLLPAFQLWVPFGMCWYFLVQKNMFVENGFGCNHDNYIFRFTGFVTFMYSGWQIIDGCDDASSKFFLTRAVDHWCLTGTSYALKEVFMFYMCYLSQTLCSLLLLIVTYIIYTTESDTPLDLLMNCVAVNFVLDIDAEWMNDRRQGKSQVAATFLYKRWRDACVDPDTAPMVHEGVKKMPFLRRNASKIIETEIWVLDWVVTVGTYVCVVGWTFCPAKY